MPRIISLSIIILLIFFLGLTFYRVIAPFLLPLFVAGVVAVVCQPMYDYFLKKTNHRIPLAAGITTGAIMMIVFIPLLVGTFIASVQLYTIAQNELTVEKIETMIERFQKTFDVRSMVERVQGMTRGRVDEDILQQEIETSFKELLHEAGKRSLGIASKAIGIIGGLFSAIIATFMFMIALYYFLSDGPALMKATETLIPVHVDYQRRLVLQFNKVVRAVVLATFMAAIAQGLATAGLLYLVGFHHFFLLFLLSTIASLIPIAGTWLVWIPCVVLLFLEGSYIAASIVIVIGVLVIGMMDNVIRTYVLHSDTKLHPLLGFVSVLGGLHVMGLWGVFIGPIVASILHALVVIFNEELKQFSREKFYSDLLTEEGVLGKLAASAIGHKVAAETEQNKPGGRKNPPSSQPPSSAPSETSHEVNPAPEPNTESEKDPGPQHRPE